MKKFFQTFRQKKKEKKGRRLLETSYSDRLADDTSVRTRSTSAISRTYEELLPTRHDSQDNARPDAQGHSSSSSDVYYQGFGSGSDDYYQVKTEREVSPAAKDRRAVVAFDIGTSGSGWAYGIRYDNNSQGLQKICTKEWQSGTIITDKTPTCILLKQVGFKYETVAFGYQAEDKYSEMVRENKFDDRHFFFRQFKMELYKGLQEGPSVDFEIEDIRHRKLPAIEVFSRTIQYLKEDLLKEWEVRIPGLINEHEILWVVTVPAIWTESSKQFMRMAASRAGIPNERLVLALEPEAASVFCRSLKVERRQQTDWPSTFQDGSRYIVLDAGGGTVDLTVHEVVGHSGLKEVKAATGGAFGGTRVDKALKEKLEEVVGVDAMSDVENKSPEDYIDLYRQFEAKKRTADPESTSQVTLTLPMPLMESYQKRRGRQLSRSCTDLAQISSNKIRWNQEEICALFKPSVDKIIDCIRKLAKDTASCAILMVGGFSESRVLQNAVKSEFKHLKVIVPAGAGSCVLKGAVVFGMNPGIISERVVRYTYGVNAESAFIKSIHPPAQMVRRKDGLFCKNIFSKHVTRGDRVVVGKTTSHEFYSPVYRDQPDMKFTIYATKKENPVVVVEEGCFPVGTITIPMPVSKGDMNRDVEVCFIYSGTEIVVEADDKASGRKTRSAVNFLG